MSDSRPSRRSFDDRQFRRDSFYDDDADSDPGLHADYGHGRRLGDTSGAVRKSRSTLGIDTWARALADEDKVHRSASADFRNDHQHDTSPASSAFNSEVPSEQYALDTLRRHPDRHREKTEKEFFKACSSGKEKKVEVLLNKDFARNAMEASDTGGTHKRHLRRVGSIVRMNADLNKLANAVDGSGRPALHLATAKGHTKVVRRLIGASALVNAKDLRGTTAAHVAAQNNRVETLKFLLEHKCDPNATTGQGLSPLHYAAEKGYLDIMQLLLDHGAELDPARDSDNATPLHVAAANNKSKACRFLIQNGASLQAQTRAGHTPKALTTKKKARDMFE